MQNKWRMVAEQEKCQVCYMCQLVCSLKQDKTFNPSKAYIEISSTVKPSGELDVGVSFTDKCDSCGLCAKYCVYGAVSREKAPVAQASS